MSSLQKQIEFLYNEIQKEANTHLNEQLFLKMQKLTFHKGGFTDPSSRLSFWSSLLSNPSQPPSQTLPTTGEPDTETIAKDIPRTNSQLLFNSDASSPQNILPSMNKETLHDIYNPTKTNYHYYQGCLDLLCYFLYAMRADQQALSVDLYKKFSEIYLKDYLNFKRIKQSDKTEINPFSTITLMLGSFIQTMDSDVYSILEENNLETCGFAVSWLVTLFSHSITVKEVEFWILDFIICNEPYMIYIISSLIIIEKVRCALKEGDVDNIQQIMFTINLNKVDFEKVLRDAYFYKRDNMDEISKILNKYYNDKYCVLPTLTDLKRKRSYNNIQEGNVNKFKGKIITIGMVSVSILILAIGINKIFNK